MIYASLIAPILLSYSLQTPRGPVVDHTGKPLTPTDANIKMADGGDPLLLRAARGETVERPPVWMMRQAGRHMKVYRDLCKKYPTFRQRSEIAEVATEISLQPWNAYQTDGVILFSDILTPLPGMGVDFDILEKAGPKMTPIRSQAAVDAMHLIDPDAACPFVRQALGALRREVDGKATVLGFIGAPYTMATYCVEGGTSSSYLEIKKMGCAAAAQCCCDSDRDSVGRNSDAIPGAILRASLSPQFFPPARRYNAPDLLHSLLTKLADSLAAYAIYQIECGAQVIQMFDSWAGNLAPADYDVFALPYQKRVVEQIKKAHPDVPLISYIAKSAALLERMRDNGCDIVSVDWTVTMSDARARLGPDVGVQGNLESAVLLSNPELIEERTLAVIKEAGPTGHIMNLGHGIEPTTPEENAKHFVDTVRNFRW